MGRVDTRRGSVVRGSSGCTRGASELDREDAGRVLAGAPGSGGVAAPAVNPVRGEAFDDGAFAGRGAAGGAGVAARDVAAVCCVFVGVRAGWGWGVALAPGALAVAAGAPVCATTGAIRATAGVTVFRVVVTRLVAGAFGRTWAADAVALVTTLVTGAVTCATGAVAVATAGTTRATAVTGFVATPETVPVTVFTRPGCPLVVGTEVAVLTVLVIGAVGAVAVLTVLVIGAVGAVAVLTVLVIGAVGAVAVAALTVFVIGAVGAVGVAAFVAVVVAGAGEAGGAGGDVTAETAAAGEVGVAAGDVAELMLDVADARGPAGLGAAAMARVGTAATIASSEVAAANNRTRLRSSLTSA